jgi:hypothetical protein
MREEIPLLILCLLLCAGAHWFRISPVLIFLLMLLSTVTLIERQLWYLPRGFYYYFPVTGEFFA